MAKKLAQIHMRLSKEYKEKFSQIAKEQGMSVNKLCLEAVETIISKYSSDKSIPTRQYAYNTNEKVKDIYKDIKHIREDISKLFTIHLLAEQQLETINSKLSTSSDHKRLEDKMKSMSMDLKYIRWYIKPVSHYDDSNK